MSIHIIKRLPHLHFGLFSTPFPELHASVHFQLIYPSCHALLSLPSLISHNPHLCLPLLSMTLHATNSILSSHFCHASPASDLNSSLTVCLFQHFPLRLWLPRFVCFCSTILSAKAGHVILCHCLPPQSTAACLA
jgi:hypothetical protein